MLLLGYAWQLGRVPLSHAALVRAIALNGVQVENNTAAFEWGRRIAADPPAVNVADRDCAGDRVRAQAWARRGAVAACDFLDRISERCLRPPVQGVRRDCASGRRRRASAAPSSRGGRAISVQAHGLQGRVRGRPSAHGPGVRGQASRNVRRGHPDCASPGAAAFFQEERPRRTGQAPLRSVDSLRLSRARVDEGTARHAARSLRLHVRRTTERALIDEYRATIEELLPA